MANKNNRHFHVASLLVLRYKVTALSINGATHNYLLTPETDNDIHNNLSDCGFAVLAIFASALQSTVG